MKDLTNNVWGIKEYEGDGDSCLIVPANLPMYKKVLLFFFRFGVCPICVTMSLAYSLSREYSKWGQASRSQNSNGTGLMAKPLGTDT